MLGKLIRFAFLPGSTRTRVEADAGTALGSVLKGKG
jgi:hypothetical protein